MKKPNLNKSYLIITAILASTQILFMIFKIIFESGWNWYEVFIPFFIWAGSTIIFVAVSLWFNSIPIDYTEED